MSNRFFNPLSSFTDANGDPLSGGTLTFYESGTSTKTNTYSDSALTTPNTNPVVLDSAGRLPLDVFLDPAVTYKVVLADSLDVAIWTADPVVDPAANVTASFTVFAGDPNGNVAGNAGSAGGSGASVVWDSANSLLYVCTTTGTTSTAVWTQVAANLGGLVQFTGVISPAALSADQDDYDPTGLSGAAIVRQDASDDVTITGLAGGAAGRIVLFENIATTDKITLAEDNVSSAAANRILIGKPNLVLYPGQSIMLVYDGTSSRWRAFGVAPTPKPDTSQATTSGTSVDFLKIPAGVNEIVVAFSNVSLDGTDDLLVQVGSVGGVETSGYVSSSDLDGTVVSSTAGFLVNRSVASQTVAGTMRLTRVTGNVWVASHAVRIGGTPSLAAYGGGHISMGGELDRVRITRSGTDSFNGGSVNIIVHP